ncbi:MAG TPA: LD-carboxypeptidase [Terriglobales bacterium]|nr:LD-carboxypeptidase [Terriglobales bacterium]
MTRSNHKALLKPPSLQRGDTVGVIAPASDIKPELLRRGCDALEKLGLKPFYFDSILRRDLYFAGSQERRLRELHDMFERDEVRAILCARGGYGCNYLLEGVDLNVVARHPKIFMGYSDITSLLTYFHDAIGLVTFHGPMVTKDFADGRIHEKSFAAAVQGSETSALEFDQHAAVAPLVEGQAEGKLYGGCLSMLTASLGTPYEVHTSGTILFIEDVAAKPYQIDRMLMQLKLAGKFDGVRGIVFGEMVDCVQSKDQDYSLREVVLRVVGNLGIPVAYGLSSGHVSGTNITLPIGVRAQLIVRPKHISLNILEAATVPAAVPVRSAKI